MSARLIKVAAFYLVAGVAMGIVMGITHEFVLAPVHAHINLLGWATLAIIGVIYHAYPAAGETRLATVHFWFHNTALPVFMVGLGFNPFLAAVLCLIANTSPVAYGGLGTPIIVLSGVTDLPGNTLSVMAGHQLPILSLIVPAYMVRCSGNVASLLSSVEFVWVESLTGVPVRRAMSSLTYPTPCTRPRYAP